MVLGPEAVSLAVMTLFGVATAVVLAYLLRDVVVRLGAGPVEAVGAEDAPEGRPVATEAAVARARRVALAGPLVYLVGFLLVVAALVLDAGRVAGVRLVDLGFAVVVLAAVPMAAAFYLAWQAG